MHILLYLLIYTVDYLGMDIFFEIDNHALKFTRQKIIEPIWGLFTNVQVQYPSGFHDSGSHFS